MNLDDVDRLWRQAEASPGPYVGRHRRDEPPRIVRACKQLRRVLRARKV